MPTKKKVKRKITNRKPQQKKNWLMRIIGMFLGALAVLTLTVVFTSPNNDSFSKIASTQDLGTFTGTLPCADCEGLKTSITFDLAQDEKKSHTYSETDVYIGKNVINTSSGTWEYVFSPTNKDAVIIELIDAKNPENKQYFQVINDTTLEMLDQNKEKIKNAAVPLILTKEY